MQPRRLVVFRPGPSVATFFPRLCLVAYTSRQVSTGAPIYLVSACVSGEEFVAAFRRYADRNGLFIPIAEPLPAGRKGRFALTLRDGGVMVEGEAEIVSAGKTPSPVHGRVGMTLKFVEPDDRSKTVLSELEKARLAMKPPPLSVPPRPAEIPATPRPVPPPVAGRIDANNALAECVAIGEIGALADAIKSAPARFVVPSIPPVGTPRPNTPSTPPRAHTPSVPPIPARPKPPTDAPPAIPPLGKSSGSQAAIPTAVVPASSAPLPTNPTPTIPTIVPSTKSTQPAAVVPPPGKPEPPAPQGTSDTMLAMRAPAEVRSKITRTQQAVVAPPPALAKQPTTTADDDNDEPIEPPAPSPRIAELVPVPQTTDTIDIESNLALIAGDTAEIAAVKPPPADEQTQTNFVLPMRPPAKPAPKEVAPPTPTVAPPILPENARSFVSPEDVEIAEPTELSEIDPEIAAAAARKTTIGVAVVPEGVTVLPAEQVRDTSLMDAQQPTAGVVGPRTVDGRAPTIPPEVQEPTPSGDWIVQTGTGLPTITPVEHAPDSTKLPTGDWTIALDSGSPDGWSEPSKVEKPQLPQPGPPVLAVASAEPLESKPDADRPADDSGPKVQIDPTLIQPLTPMPGDDNSFTPMPADALAPPSASYPQQHPIVPMSGFPTPAPPNPAFAMRPPFDARGSAPHLPAPANRRRIVVIALSALLVVAVGVVALITLGGGSRPATTAGSGAAPTPTPAAGSAAQVAAPGSGSAAIAAGSGSASAQLVEEKPPGTCKVAVTTVPEGAELVIGKQVVGKSNTTLELPCDVATKLVVRKATFVSQTRPITPTSDSKPLKIALSKQLFTVKVSSKPPGATVTAHGKSLGVTPMITKLPAFEATTLVFTKDGFTKATQKITPKANNQALQATLQRKRRR